MSFCMGCMQEIGSAKVCPNCGFDNTQKQDSPFLPYGTELVERYVVGKRLETNGESTRYIGYDKQTGDIVVIREYLPIGHCDRKEGQTAVTAVLNHDETYTKLKHEFISYFKIIEQLKDLSAMMIVYSVFEENNTAYVIEENEDMISFEEYVQRSNGHIDWDVARPLFMPVISALEAMHKNGIGHYAIAPSNMFITSLGKIKLTGFSTAFERKRGTALKSQLFSGCAAPEQYEKNFPIDDITDIYGFTATLFYALTGNIPTNAQERLKDSRLLMSTNTVKRLPPHVVTALANGLNIKRENRITNFDDLRSQLSAAPTVQAIQEEISRTASMTPVEEEKEHPKSGMSSKTIVIISLVVSLIVFSIFGFIWTSQNPLEGLFINNKNVEPTTTSVDEEWTGPVVENYVGKTYAEVATAADSDDNVAIVRAYEDEYSDSVPEGSIISQSPAAGSPIKSEGEISIYVTVSKGTLTRELPKIENLTVAEAAKTLADLGFLVTEADEYSDKYAEQRVIAYKDNQPGDKLEAGASITIRVSKGKMQTTTTP